MGNSNSQPPIVYLCYLAKYIQSLPQDRIKLIREIVPYSSSHLLIPKKSSSNQSSSKQYSELVYHNGLGCIEETENTFITLGEYMDVYKNSTCVFIRLSNFHLDNFPELYDFYYPKPKRLCGSC